MNGLVYRSNALVHTVNATLQPLSHVEERGVSGLPATLALLLTANGDIRSSWHGIHKAAQKKILSASLLVLGLSGCALLPEKEAASSAAIMPMAAPLGPARRIEQQLTAHWAGKDKSMLVVLELDAAHIAMAGLSNDGLSLFNLTYDGHKVVSDKSPLLPESVEPQLIIADLQLVYWPVAALQKILPADWRLDANTKQRTLFNGLKKQTEVTFLSPDPVWPKTVELVNFQYHYQLQIKTLSYELIP